MANGVDLSKAFAEIIDEYTDEVKDALDVALPKAAKSTAKYLKGHSPQRTGEYAKGWAVKTEKGRLGHTSIVWNKTHYRLTHLLEKGHVNRDGGFTAARVHIAPAEDYAEEEAVKELEKELKR